MEVFTMIDGGETDVESSGREVIIRHYGLLEPENWSRDCELEFDRINNFWNVLIDIHEHYKLLYIKQLSQLEIFSAAKRHFETFESSSSMTDMAKDAKKELAIIQKEATKLFGAELRALEMSRRNEVKVARQNSGLWWGNYNATVRAFERARSAAVRAGGTMRRRSSGMDARITNTLQGGADVSSLFDGSLSQLSIRPVSDRAWSAESRGERRRLQRTTLNATVFVNAGERRTVTWPMIMHRPIPDDCRVKEVIITRRRAANKWKWAVSFACQRNVVCSTEVPKKSNNMAVDFGWRRVPTGVKVATFLSDKGEAQFLVMPNDLLASFEFLNDLSGRITACAERGYTLLDECNEMLLQQPYRDLLLSARTRTKKSISQLLDFCNSQFFFKRPVDGCSKDIEEWRSEFIRLTTWRSNHRRKIMSRRLHLYQNAANDVLKGANSIILGDVKFGEISRRKGREVNQAFFPSRANYYRNVAAPSELVRCLILQAKKRQVPLSKQAIPTPVPCPNCGSPVRATRADMLIQQCANCGIQYDIDVAACEALLSLGHQDN